jgi:hypothetical protein
MIKCIALAIVTVFAMGFVFAATPARAQSGAGFEPVEAPALLFKHGCRYTCPPPRCTGRYCR